MGQLKIIGWIVFLAVLALGGKLFMDYRNSEDAKAEQKACAYFNSLMQEQQDVNLNAQTGGPVVHPWALTNFPTQLEMEEAAKLPHGKEGEDLFTWQLHCEPGGKLLRLGAKFDSQGNLASFQGLHGTVTRNPSEWQP